MGSFPIAQLREPYTTVRYLAERLDLVKMLRIQHPDDDSEWCAMDICDGNVILLDVRTIHSKVKKSVEVLDSGLIS